MTSPVPTDNERYRELRQELDRILPRLAEDGARKVILFGSLARGDVRPDSDLDLIVVKETTTPFIARSVETLRRLIPEVATDILIYTPGEFNRMLEWNSFIRQAVAEGVVVYEAHS